MKKIMIFALLLITFNLVGQSNQMNGDELKRYWQINGIDENEGFYQGKIGIFTVKKIDNGYLINILDFNLQVTDKYWHCNLKATAKPKTFTGNVEFTVEFESSFYVNRSLICIFEDGDIIINGDTSLKIFPTVNDNIKSSSKIAENSSGTGFGISSNGVIVTNYHVIEGANTIKVKGIYTDFSKSYNAKVIVSDKKNDLALIQIDDKSFTSLGTIPYIIKTSISSVGENIFVMGYPLRASMGDEIKLTNGIISSKTGYQGDISSYQISAPIQPGNSGGPLFNSQGNLIGIVNAKLSGAENASYAIKTNYLTNLFELLSSPPILQTTNLLAGKSLTTQVETIKKFVYIIEIN